MSGKLPTFAEAMAAHLNALETCRIVGEIVYVGGGRTGRCVWCGDAAADCECPTVKHIIDSPETREAATRAAEALDAWALTDRAGTDQAAVWCQAAAAKWHKLLEE